MARQKKLSPFCRRRPTAPERPLHHRPRPRPGQRPDPRRVPRRSPLRRPNRTRTTSPALTGGSGLQRIPCR